MPVVRNLEDLWMVSRVQALRKEEQARAKKVKMDALKARLASDEAAELARKKDSSAAEASPENSSSSSDEEDDDVSV